MPGRSRMITALPLVLGRSSRFGLLPALPTKDNPATLPEIEHTDAGRHVHSSAANACYLR
jgi:hypothetical protein